MTIDPIWKCLRGYCAGKCVGARSKDGDKELHLLFFSRFWIGELKPVAREVAKCFFSWPVGLPHDQGQLLFITPVVFSKLMVAIASRVLCFVFCPKEGESDSRLPHFVVDLAKVRQGFLKPETLFCADCAKLIAIDFAWTE